MNDWRRWAGIVTRGAILTLPLGCSSSPARPAESPPASASPAAVASAPPISSAPGPSSAVTLEFDDTMKGALPPQGFAAIWSSLEERLGPFRAVERIALHAERGPKGLIARPPPLMSRPRRPGLRTRHPSRRRMAFRSARRPIRMPLRACPDRFTVRTKRNHESYSSWSPRLKSRNDKTAHRLRQRVSVIAKRLGRAKRCCPCKPGSSACTPPRVMRASQIVAIALTVR